MPRRRAISRGFGSAQSRDISDRATLRELWGELGLPAEALAAADAPDVLEQVRVEHAEALELGVTGVPAVRLADGDVAIVGAHPVELYRRWVNRMRARAEGGSA
jgi:predicted DsbA family dithiol-disulfide isomerase